MIYEVAIIGGGLAGLTAAIDLSQKGYSVVLFEKKSYPQYKVCGEYVSNEVLPYLRRLGVDPLAQGANAINVFEVSAGNGKKIKTLLPLGGFGWSRYAFDYHLYQKANLLGVETHQKTTVEHVEFIKDYFKITTLKGGSFSAKIVLGSYGKRANMDKKLNRPFYYNHSEYLGVKHFLKGQFPSNQVSIYNFNGGYCGAVLVEDDTVSIAYLTRHKYLKQYGGIEGMESALLHQNPLLKKLLQDSEKIKERTKTISNVSFEKKSAICEHMLMIGDAAGLIAPICGNGMAMAIHGAKIAADLANGYLQNRISRQEMETKYQQVWQTTFGKRLYWGRNIQNLMGNPYLSAVALIGLKAIPSLLPRIIQYTHGKEI